VGQSEILQVEAHFLVLPYYGVESVVVSHASLRIGLDSGLSVMYGISVIAIIKLTVTVTELTIARFNARGIQQWYFLFLQC
jgi:hypothetical protein